MIPGVFTLNKRQCEPFETKATRNSKRMILGAGHVVAAGNVPHLTQLPEQNQWHIEGSVCSRTGLSMVPFSPALSIYLSSNCVVRLPLVMLLFRHTQCDDAALEGLR